MVDLKEECLLVTGEQDNISRCEVVKYCTGCHTTSTPLWRGGPAGPKTLCNACGIKYHKKRRALLGIENGKAEKPKIKKKKMRNSIGTEEDNKSSPIRVPLKIKMVLKKFYGGGADFLARNLGEEEQAAILLMALSCGSVSA